MVHVSSHHRMEQQQLSSLFHVQIGLMKMEFKIIHSLVEFFFESNQFYFIVFLAWTNERSEQMMIAYSVVSTFTVRLPAGNRQQNFLLHLIIHIRDTVDCIQEINISSVIVIVDTSSINQFIQNLQGTSVEKNRNPYIRLLSSGNQNIVGQILISLSQEFNRMNTENLHTAISSNFLPHLHFNINN